MVQSKKNKKIPILLVFLLYLPNLERLFKLQSPKKNKKQNKKNKKKTKTKTKRQAF